MLNFAEFQEYAKNHIKEYLPDEYANAEVSLSTVDKNNGLQLHAILVRPENSNISPTIYLEGFFKKYEEGAGIKDIMGTVAETVVKHQNAPEGTENIAQQFRDFEFIKERVIMTAVNAERNQRMLENTPHTMKEDLAIIYKVLLDPSNEGMATITIKNEHMDFWGVTKETLHELAVNNSNRILPATVRGMNEIMMEMMGRDMPPEIAEAIMADMPAEEQMFVISNSANVNGASALFYSDALEKLSEKVGTDLYILPSSVHECIAVSSEMGTPESLAEMVQEVNGTQVAIDEQLSDHVYFYDAKSKDITLADTTVEDLGITLPSETQSIDASNRATGRH